MGDDFDVLMQSIGILNSKMKETLWKNIENVANGDKSIGIDTMGAHGITKSQMFEDSDLDNADFKMEIDENANKELKRRIFEINQELDVLKKEKKEMELRMNDDDVIVRSEIETIGKDDDESNNEYTTPIGADPNSVVAL